MPQRVCLAYGRLMAADVDETPKSPFLPPRWVITSAWKMHRALYRVSGGRLGLRPAVDDTYGLARLTTTGRRSGTDRTVFIGYFHDGENLITMAMNGWGAAEPAWWLNLQANPDAKLVTPDGPVFVTGRAATGPERDRLWQRWAEIDEGIDGYASRRPTETAVVILSPHD